MTAARSEIAAVIIYGADRYFCAGGDLRELGTPSANAWPRLSADVLPAIEDCSKPVIAALHGAAIGGGFELALACHYRVAASDTRIALPELKHGIIPLSGTQRLPRLWGIEKSLDMMMGSLNLSAADFADSAVFDRVVTGSEVLPAAIEFARALPRARDMKSHHERALVKNRPYADPDRRAVWANSVARYARPEFTPAQSALLAAVKAGIEAPDFATGLAESQWLYDQLTPVSNKRNHA